MIQDKTPFVRINTKVQFTGKNIRSEQGEKVFNKGKHVGSMMIYPGYEVEY